MDLPLSRSLVFYNLIGALGQFFAALFYHRVKRDSRAANRAAKQYNAGKLQSIQYPYLCGSNLFAIKIKNKIDSKAIALTSEFNREF